VILTACLASAVSLSLAGPPLPAGEIVNNDSVLIVYGPGWSEFVIGAPAQNGDVHCADGFNEYASITFVGTALTLYAHGSTGTGELCISETTTCAEPSIVVDTYSATTVAFGIDTWPYMPLDYGLHTLYVVMRDAAAVYACIDAVYVWPSVIPTAAPPEITVEVTAEVIVSFPTPAWRAEATVEVSGTGYAVAVDYAATAGDVAQIVLLFAILAVSLASFAIGAFKRGR
jgi:hypothetical protein